ncbi:hypothetical protein HOG27_02815 [bacterium]|jgi:hypothetical protein|nr:hypothetical protein [bacterium]
MKNIKNIKKAIIVVYVLFLVTLSLIFAVIILNNNSYLFNITEYNDIDSELYLNMDKD